MNHFKHALMRRLLREFLTRADPPRTCCRREVAPEVILTRQDIENIRQALEPT